MDKVLLAILLLDGIILIAAILLQAGTGGGLASLGGGGGTDTVMGGRQAVTLLTRVTWWGSGLFLSLSLVLSLMSAGGTGPRSVLQGAVPAPTPVQSSPLPFGAPQQGATQAPAAPAAPAPSQTPNR